MKKITVIFISFLLILIKVSYAVDSGNANEADPEYHVNLAKSYFKNAKSGSENFLDKAIEEYSKAISLKSDNSSWYVARGFLYGFQGKKEEAIEDFNKAIHLEPENPAYFSLRANAYKDKDDVENALGDYEKAINLNPNIAFFYSERGELLTSKERWEEAIRDYSMAIKLKPDSLSVIESLFKSVDFLMDILITDGIVNNRDAYLLSQYYYNRGFCYEMNSKPTEAIADYEQSIILYPDSFISSILNNLYIKEKRLSEGIKFFSRVISLQPKDAGLYSSRADIYRELKQYKNAIDDYSKTIELRKYSSDYSSRANVYSEMKQYDKALRDYNEAIKLKPDFPFLYFSRGIVKRNMNNYYEAESDFEMACESVQKIKSNHYYCDYLKNFKKEIARGEKWTEFDITDNYVFFYDKTRVKKQSNKHIRAWVRIEVKDIQKFIEERKKQNRTTDGYEQYSHTLTLWEYDCDGGNMGTLSTIDYNDKGNVLYSFNPDTKSPSMSPIIPDSIADTLYKIVCKTETASSSK